MRKLRKMKKIRKKFKLIPKNNTGNPDKYPDSSLKERTDVVRGERSKSLVELSLKADQPGQYPIKVDKTWGNEVTYESLDTMVYLWKDHMTMLTSERVDGLRKLVLGLTASQLWEVYIFIRDLGVITDGKPSIHGRRINQAIEFVRKQRAAKDAE